MEVTISKPYRETLETGKVLNVTVLSGSAVVQAYMSNVKILDEVITASKTYGTYASDVRMHVSQVSGTSDASESLLTAPSYPVISSSAPSDSDGRPNGTIYIQTA